MTVPLPNVRKMTPGLSVGLAVRMATTEGKQRSMSFTVAVRRGKSWGGPSAACARVAGSAGRISPARAKANGTNGKVRTEVGAKRRSAANGRWTGIRPTRSKGPSAFRKTTGGAATFVCSLSDRGAGWVLLRLGRLAYPVFLIGTPCG